jgi:hypothetical protein
MTDATKRVEFEAWAVRDGDALVESYLPCVGPLLMRDDEAKGLLEAGAPMVRVRVTVDVIGGEETSH